MVSSVFTFFPPPLTRLGGQLGVWVHITTGPSSYTSMYSLLSFSSFLLRLGASSGDSNYIYFDILYDMIYYTVKYAYDII